MSKFIYTDGEYYYPTNAGKVVLLLLAIAVLIVTMLIVSRHKTEKRTTSVKPLVCSALLIALAYVTSYIQFFSLPLGGSITLMSMFFITYIGYCFGIRAGIASAFAFSILQFLQGPYILTPFQVCCDYFLAFSALGLSGLFRNTKGGLYIGYIVGAVARGLFHVLGGYLYWLESMPEDFPKAFQFLYPFAYNFSFIGAEMILTLVVISVPAVRKVLVRLKTMANQ